MNSTQSLRWEAGEEEREYLFIENFKQRVDKGKHLLRVSTANMKSRVTNHGLA